MLFQSGLFQKNQSTDSTGGSIVSCWENGPEWGLKTVSFNSLLPIIYANTEDPDQMPHSAASDLDLHCLPKSQSMKL